MVKIRLARQGAKKRPYYHLVVTDSQSPRDGKFLEQIGIYDPSREDETRLELARVDHWVAVGAQLTDRARRIVNVYRRAAATAAAAAADGAALPERAAATGAA